MDDYRANEQGSKKFLFAILIQILAVIYLLSFSPFICQQGNISFINPLPPHLMMIQQDDITR